MQPMKATESLILAVVDGDLEAVSSILTAHQSDLLQATKNLPKLTVRKAALVRVLTAWGGDKACADRVQQWASFVRRGYVSAPANHSFAPIEAIEIRYDENDEELIAGIIGRFDELGDQIDGEIEEKERHAMLSALLA